MSCGVSDGRWETGGSWTYLRRVCVRSRTSGSCMSISSDSVVPRVHREAVKSTVSERQQQSGSAEAKRQRHIGTAVDGSMRGGRKRRHCWRSSGSGYFAGRFVVFADCAKRYYDLERETVLRVEHREADIVSRSGTQAKEAAPVAYWGRSSTAVAAGSGH